MHKSNVSRSFCEGLRGAYGLYARERKPFLSRAETFFLVSANLFHHESKVAKAKGGHRECNIVRKKIGPRCLLNESNAGPILRWVALSGLAVF